MFLFECTNYKETQIDHKYWVPQSPQLSPTQDSTQELTTTKRAVILCSFHLNKTPQNKVYSGEKSI